MSCVGNTVTSCPNSPEKWYRSAGRSGHSRESVTSRSLMRTPTHGLAAFSQISQP
jgi:hypothetical protein